MDDNKIELTYEAIVRLDVTASGNGTLSASRIEVEYNNPWERTRWKDNYGQYTEAGIDALIFGFCNGLTATIRYAGQMKGMDTAVLLERAMTIIKNNYVSNAKINNQHEHSNH